MIINTVYTYCTEKRLRNITSRKYYKYYTRRVSRWNMIDQKKKKI